MSQLGENYCDVMLYHSLCCIHSLKFAFDTHIHINFSKIFSCLVEVEHVL